MDLQNLNKLSSFPRIRSFFKLNIITSDILIIFFLLIIFGTVYLVSPKKLSDSSIISPLQIPKPSSQSPNPENNFKNKEVIGFLPSWSVAQNVSVDTKSLTQLIYFGLGVNGTGEIVTQNEQKDPTLEWHYFNSENFIKSRKEAMANKTKVLIAFKMFDNKDIDNLISNNVSTNYFIKNAIKLLKTYNLDGINLDIEYFTDSDFPTSKFLNTFLDKVSTVLKKVDPRYIVSVDVNATVILNDSAYDMVKIGEIADQIIIMAYDYHTGSSIRAGPAAPLDAPINAHSISESVNSITGRVPLEKIILGIPLYGYEWQTLNKNHKSTAVSGSGALATYKRVAELLSNRNDIIKHWDEEAQSPWLVYTQSGAIKQIYYENYRSLKEKAEFVNSKNLGGVALWALGYEGENKEIFDIFKK